jgi:hypothetical protein
LSTTALSPVVTGTGTAIGSIFGSVFTALSSIAS